MDIFEEIVRLRKAGRKGALATIVEVQGSIPSHESSKILVRDDGSIAGTVGGGCVEAEVWSVAQEVMREEKPRRLHFNLNANPEYDNGLICGGSLDIFVEPILATPTAFILGGGHVGLNVARVAKIAGFDVVVADDREAFANKERFPEASETLRRAVGRDIPQAQCHQPHLPGAGDARPQRRPGLPALGRDHRGALHRHDREQAQVHRDLQSPGARRRAGGAYRARALAHRARYRRAHAGRNRRVHRGGDDRGAAQRHAQRSLPGIQTESPAHHMIAGLILAAGESRRMGRDKALLTYRGRTFLETIIG